MFVDAANPHDFVSKDILLQTFFIGDSHSKLANGLFTFAGFPSSISEIQLALELGLKGFVVAEDRLKHAYVCDQHAKVLCVIYV